jgi:hypothetical protein
MREARSLGAVAARGREAPPGARRPALPDGVEVGGVEASAGNGDVLACGMHVAAIVALILDMEERDELTSLGDIAAMFGVERADVEAALSHYHENLRRLRPMAHARRRVLPSSASLRPGRAVGAGALGGQDAAAR